MSGENQIHILNRMFAAASVLLLCITAFGYPHKGNQTNEFRQLKDTFKLRAKKEITKAEALIRLKEKAAEAKDYVYKEGYDVSYCFLVDMRLPSGKNRFFAYNLLKDSLEIEGLVAHGKGSENGSEDLIFSNRSNSKCTSLGKYKMGESYVGSFGLSYKMAGLDKTNNNASSRLVVLHSYYGVPNEEIYPNLLCVSEGCPMVSPEFLEQLKTYMDDAQEPILMWIYY